MAYSGDRRKQAAAPVPDAEQIRARAIKRLLALAEADEAPATSIAACRALLGLDDLERERPTEAIQSSEEGRLAASRLIQEAFEEIAARAPAPLPEQAPPGEPVEVEAIPVPEGEVKPVNVTPSVHRPVARPIPFDRRYGRKLNRGY